MCFQVRRETECIAADARIVNTMRPRRADGLTLFSNCRVYAAQGGHLHPKELGSLIALWKKVAQSNS
jgi:hypothetical protein